MNKAGDNVEFSKERANPTQFNNTICNSPVFKLNNGMRYNFLLCKRPWDEIRAHKHTVIVDTLTIMKDGSIVKISKTC